MFCEKCGAQLPDGTAFCGACGQPTGAAQQPQYAQPQYAQPQYAQPQYAQPQPQYSQYGSAPTAPARANKGPAIKAFVFGIISFVLSISSYVLGLEADLTMISAKEWVSGKYNYNYYTGSYTYTPGYYRTNSVLADEARTLAWVAIVLAVVVIAFFIVTLVNSIKGFKSFKRAQKKTPSILVFSIIGLLIVTSALVLGVLGFVMGAAIV